MQSQIMQQESKLQMLQGGLPQDYGELREPSVPDLSEVFGQVQSATSSVKITLLAADMFCTSTLSHIRTCIFTPAGGSPAQIQIHAGHVCAKLTNLY